MDDSRKNKTPETVQMVRTAAGLRLLYGKPPVPGSELITESMAAALLMDGLADLMPSGPVRTKSGPNPDLD